MAQLRRDLRMVIGGWRGERHPLVPRPAGARARPRRGAGAARPWPVQGDLPAAAAVPQPVTVHRLGRAHHIQAGPGETILDAALAAGLPMRFSCAMGGCGTCRVRLRSGRVVAEEPGCLSEAERRAGYVLACVSRPAGPVEIEVI